MTRKNAVITGAASGIGRRTAERLLAEGYDVWALDLSPDGLAGFEDEAGAGSRLHGLACDVSNPASVKAAFDAIKGDVKRLDALICCAGVARTGTLEAHTPQDVDVMLGVNIKGPWLTLCEALPLLRHGASTAAPTRVVMVGSVSGIRPKVGTGFYGATKAALHALTGVFAVELAPSGVLVNAVAPGPTVTPMLEGASTPREGVVYTVSGQSPLGRMGQPDDIADVVLFLLSDAAKYVNGVVLPVDGGFRAAFYRDLPKA